MARRSDIDWTAVECDYVAGSLSNAQIALKYGIADSSIRLKAKENGWKRNLAHAIKARTAEKIATIDVAQLIEQSAHESAEKSAETILSAVETASDIATGIVLKHRAMLRRDAERAERLEQIFDQGLDELEKPSDALPYVQAFATLATAKSKVIDAERKIFDIGAERSVGQNLDDFLDALADA